MYIFWNNTLGLGEIENYLAEPSMQFDNENQLVKQKRNFNESSYQCPFFVCFCFVHW